MTIRKLFLIIILAVSNNFTAATAADNGRETPEIQHWTTANGARVYFVPAPELPMVDIRIAFDAGSAREGAKGGLALLTNALLSEGAGQLNADQIAEKFENLGAQFGTNAHRDMATASLRSLTDPKFLQPALETLTLILHDPTFPESNFERERKRMLISLQAEKQNPEAIADRALFKAIYQQHPYARMPMGTEETVKTLNRDDLKAFHARYYVAKNAVIAIVGAVDRKNAAAIADQVIGKLPKGAAPPPLPDVPVLAQPVMEKISFPSMQTHIIMGQPGMRRGDPDYFTLFVGNHILGGSGLVSQLSDEIREKRGLSYSVYSDLSPMRQNGPFVVGLQTRNDQVDTALQVTKDTVKNFVAKGPTAEELLAAKRNITGGFPLRLAGNGKIVDYLSVIGFYGLPLDYLENFNKQIEAVTVEKIRDAFARRINPDKLATVIVGGQS